MSNKIVEKITAKHNYWRNYYRLFDPYVKEAEEERKKMTDRFAETPPTREDIETLQSMSYRQQVHLSDLRDLTTELVSLYRLAHSEGLDEEFEEEVLNNLKGLDANQPKQFFIPTEKVLEERVKGSLDKELNKLKEQLSGEQYEKMMKNAAKMFEDI